MRNRPRRLRYTPQIRALVKETPLSTTDLVMPVFIQNNKIKQEPITSLKNIHRYNLDGLIPHCKELLNQNITAIALFPNIDDSLKNDTASHALDKENILCKAIQTLKSELPDLQVITDIALDPYSTTGHDGIVKNGEILNDESIKVLAKMALLHANAGADFVAPSDMMDGRVAAIRDTLDQHKFTNTGIISYTAKYASSLYGPFRDALNSAPKNGDKKTYQMDPANVKEALKEAVLDEQEGADILLVKPAMSYLDIIYRLSQQTTCPIAAYHVSGEYAQLHAAAELGYLNYNDAIMENITAIKRAGASLIFTYAALDIARQLNA